MTQPLSLIDLLALYSASREGGQMDFNAPEICFRVGMRERLEEAELIGNGNKLTQKALTLVESVKPKLEELKAGVPVQRRARDDSKDAESSDAREWVSGSYRHKPWMCNGEVLILGKASKEMKATEGSSNVRSSVAATFHQFCAGRSTEFVAVEPFAYQVDPVSWFQMLWLRSEDGQTVAVQTKYFDLIKQRYPSASFFLRTKMPADGKVPPLQARVVNRGLKNNVVALLMPVLPGENLSVPVLAEQNGGGGGEM
jgi:hypothetical protein